MKLSGSILFTVILCLVVAGSASASMLQSSCTIDTVPGAGFTCNVFDTDNFGVLGDPANALQLPNLVVSGFLVLIAPGLDVNDPTITEDPINWTGIADFFDDGVNSFLQFFPQRFSPDMISIVQANDPFFFPQSPTNPTVFFADPNTYLFFSVSPIVPEPAAFILAGGGLALIWLRRRLR
jgi:PEP-CTERM motif